MVSGPILVVGSNSRTGDWSPSTGSSALAAASVPWMCYFKHSGKFRGNFSEKHGPWFSLIHFDGCIFFKGVGSTTKEENLGNQTPTKNVFPRFARLACQKNSPSWKLYLKAPQIGKGKSHVTNCPISGFHEFVFFGTKFY